MTTNSFAHPVAFKEWSLICDLLGSGQQSIILRKGGIAEGRDGFQFKEREFFLFPTFFHEQISRIRDGSNVSLSVVKPPEDSKVAISLFAQIEFACEITSLENLTHLAPFHYWSEQTILERFEWGRGRSIKFAFVRIFLLSPTWELDNRPEFAGCKSWIDLPMAPEKLIFEPVLTEEQHALRRAEILRALAVGSPQEGRLHETECANLEDAKKSLTL